MNWGDARLSNRFWDKVVPEPNSGCWLWSAYADPAGYGRFGIGGVSHRVHRVTYVACYGAVSAGLEVDHRCHTRPCCNPRHLEAVSHAVNVRRGRLAESNARRHVGRMHCKRGHAYPVPPSLSPSGTRVCPTCVRARRDAIRAKGGV